MSPRVQRRLWAVGAVWVAFWALYPTFGRPRAFAAAIRSGANESEACNPVPDEKTRQACWQAAAVRQQQSLDAIKLRGEYAGYAPWGLGAGLGVPVAVALWIVIGEKRRARRPLA